MTRVLRRGVRMATLGEFTSTFTDTGGNLSMNPSALAEGNNLAHHAPLWMRTGRPLFVFLHRLRRLFGGIYRQQPFTYEIFTRTSPAKRVRFEAERPTFAWKLSDHSALAAERIVS
jgi:hypothetical protein